MEVQLNERMLYVNGSQFRLDMSLCSVEVSRVLNRDNERALTLRYENVSKRIPYDEAEDIFLFLDGKGLSKKLQVCSGEDDFPNISVVSEMGVVVRA